MAFAATADTAHPSFVSRAAAAIGLFTTDYVEARSRHDEFEALEALSDAELATRGLTRDGIARHVFADTFYL